MPAEQGGGILIKCDCATTTHLIVECEGPGQVDQEVAVTCDGCQTVRWISVKTGPS